MDLSSSGLRSALHICGSGVSQRLVQDLYKTLAYLLLIFAGILSHSLVAFVALGSDFFFQKDGNFSIGVLTSTCGGSAHITVEVNFGLPHA